MMSSKYFITPQNYWIKQGEKRIFSYRATSLPVVRGEQTDSWFVFINKGDFKVDVKGRQNQEIVSYAVLARCVSRLSLCRRLFRVCLCRCLLWSMSGSTELLLGDHCDVEPGLDTVCSQAVSGTQFALIVQQLFRWFLWVCARTERDVVVFCTGLALRIGGQAKFYSNISQFWSVSAFSAYL